MTPRGTDVGRVARRTAYLACLGALSCSTGGPGTQREMWGAESALNGHWAGNRIDDETGEAWEMEAVLLDVVGFWLGSHVLGTLVTNGGDCGYYWFDGKSFVLEVHAIGFGLGCNGLADGFEGQGDEAVLAGTAFDGPVSERPVRGVFEM